MSAYKTYPAWRRPTPAPMPLRLVTEDATAQLEEILAAWRLWQESANLSERTITERAFLIINLVNFVGCAPLDLTPKHIIAFLTRPGIGNTTKATYHAHIRIFCEYLVMTGQRDDNPALRTPKPRRTKGVPRPCTPEQVRAVLGAATRRRTRMMILLAAFAGLRIHEIAKIRGEDIDRDARLLYVVGKGSKPATVPLHALILDYLHMFPTTGYWFPSYASRTTGSPHIGVKAVGKSISNAMERAGVEATPHQLRHFFGTSLVRNGVDLRTVQELMRHESLATTALYTEISDEQRKNAIAGLYSPELQRALSLDAGR